MIDFFFLCRRSRVFEDLVLESVLFSIIITGDGKGSE